MLENFKNGFIKENPVFSLFLGMCSALAVSTTLNNGLGMGVCVTIILIVCNVVISLLRKITPNEIRIPVFIVVIASVVSIVDMLVHAYALSLYDSLGMFLQLIVVNCIILGRAEAFASKNGVLASAIDGLGMGLGYTFAICLISVTREFLATMPITLINPFTNEVIFSFAPAALEAYKISLFQSSTGSFLVFACFAALFSVLKNRKPKEAAK